MVSSEGLVWNRNAAATRKHILPSWEHFLSQYLFNKLIFCLLLKLWWVKLPPKFYQHFSARVWRGVERHSVLNSHNCEINKKAQRHELRKEDQPCFSWCDSLHCHKHHAVQDTQWAAAARCADHHLLWYLVQRWSYPPTLLHGCVKNSSLSKVYTRTSISYKASAEIPIILSSIMPLRGCTNSTTFDWKKRNF